MNALVPVAPAVPFLAAPALMAFTRWLPRRAADLVAIATALATAAITGVLLIHSFSRAEVHWFGGWQPRGNVALGISFAVDPLGAGMAFFASTLFVAAFVFSWRYFDEVGALSHVLQLLFLGAMVAFAFAGDLFTLFVFLELMTTIAVALAGYQVEEEHSLQGAFNFGVMNTLAAIALLFGIALIYGRTGALNLAQIGRAVAGSPPDGLLICALTLVAVGFLVKAGVVPFHFWLADAYAPAPATICALFAGVMTEFGLFGFARVFWTVFSGMDGSAGARDALLAVGAVTALVGATMAFLQRHLKRMLAYSSIAYTGVFLIGIALLSAGGLAGSALYVLAHGFAKAALFLCAGILLERTGRVDELELHGRGRRFPVTATIWFVAAFALAGPPFVGTFLGHGLIEDDALAHGHWWVAPLLALVTALSAGAILRAGARVFLGLGPARDPLLTPEPPEEPEDERAGGPPNVLRVVPAVLGVAAVLVGTVPALALRAEEGAHQFVDRRAYAALVLDGRQPPHPHVSHSTTASSIAWATGAVAGAFGLAVFGLYRRRIGAAWRGRAWRVAAPALGGLRTVHSGHIGDYVAWFALGAAVLGGLFAATLS